MHAIEPFPSTFARLRVNARRSRLANLVAWPVAVGDRFGSARVWPHDHGDSGSTTTIGGRGVVVPRLPLDSLIDEDRRVRLLKIDVEGYEPAVLDGARQTLERTDAALVELNRPGLEAHGSSPDEVRSRLGAAGLSVQREILPRYSRLRKAGEVTNLLASRPSG